MSHAPVSSVDDPASAVAAGLASRVRLLVRSLDRLDRLESGSGAWLSGFEGTELPDSAMEMTLRALRTTADRTNFALLKMLAAGGSHSFSDLAVSSKLDRLTLSERLNDLIQVGFAARLIDTDHAQITPSGAAMVRLVEELAHQVAAEYKADA